MSKGSGWGVTRAFPKQITPPSPLPPTYPSLAAASRTRANEWPPLLTPSGHPGDKRPPTPCLLASSSSLCPMPPDTHSSSLSLTISRCLSLSLTRTIRHYLALSYFLTPSLYSGRHPDSCSRSSGCRSLSSVRPQHSSYGTTQGVLSAVPRSSPSSHTWP